MSIINDALKKAERERDEKKQPPKEREQGYADNKGPAEDRGQADNKARINKNYISRVILLIIGIGIIVYFFSSTALKENAKKLIGYATLRIKPQDEKLTTASEMPARQAKIPSTLGLSQDTEVPQKGPEFLLTGIVRGEGSPMAIINGSVYTVGDEVDTAKVLEIYDESVILEKDGKRIELRTK